MVHDWTLASAGMTVTGPSPERSRRVRGLGARVALDQLWPVVPGEFTRGLTSKAPPGVMGSRHHRYADRRSDPDFQIAALLLRTARGFTIKL